MPAPAGRGRWIGRAAPSPTSRAYDVYLPAGRRGAALPLLLLLHGCQQRSVDFATASGITAAADTHGFIVVAPRQERRYQIQGCWRWYDAAHQRRDAGEPAMLRGVVADLVQPHADWRIDPRRVYAAGLSAGGSMALILAATYPDVFAAAGVHSATAYGSASQGFAALRVMAARGRDRRPGVDRRIAPVVVVQGTADRVVRSPNSDRIVEQWLAARGTAARGLDRIRPLASTKVIHDGGRHCTRTRWYTVTGRPVLEHWRVDGLEHAWSGGRSAGAFVDRDGPDAAELIWRFLSRHRTSGQGPRTDPGSPGRELPALAIDDLGHPLPIW